VVPTAPPSPKPEISPAVVAPYPDEPDNGPDWGFGSLVALMIPATLAAAAAAAGGGAGGTGDTGGKHS
jgi:hypothetical protein